MKKLISFLIAIAVITGAFSFDAGAVRVGEYEITEVDSGAEIISYNGNASALTVPETINGLTVTGIGKKAFRNSSVKSVKLPTTVKYISDSAFAEMNNLTDIDFGSSLETIGNTAFYDCVKLTSALRFPSTLKKIGESAFENCWDMTYAEIPSGVEEIGYCAFGFYYEQDVLDKKYYDHKRSDFKLFGYSGTAAEVYADSHKLDFYDMNKNVRGVSFKGMDFYISADNYAELTAYNDVSDVLNIPETVEGCQVKSIGAYALFNSAIKSVTIPKTVEEIGEWAFEGCGNLKRITVPPTVKTVKEGALGYYYEDGFNRPYLDFVICGAPNSGAKEYADKYEFEFEDVYTTFVTLKKRSGTVYVKGTLNVNASVKNSVGKTTYTSADKAVAKVNSKGMITAKKAGKTKITVMNNGVKKIFTVTVKNPYLNITKAKIKAGKIYKLRITGKVGEAVFSSSDPRVVKVNPSTGKYKGLRKGKAVITVKTNGIKLRCKVTVRV